MGLKATIPYANAYLLTQVLPEIMTEVLTDRVDDEEKEEIGKYVLARTVTAPLKGIVGVRDIVSAWEFGRGGRGYTPSPMARTVTDGLRVLSVAADITTGEKGFDDLTRYDARALTDLAGVVTHMPTRQAFTTADYFHAWLVGDENPDNAGELLYRGLVTGRKIER